MPNTLSAFLVGVVVGIVFVFAELAYDARHAGTDRKQGKKDTE